ncbi:MAG: hypothetical protein H6506_04285 [Calditrichaeota bacterium]|nr:hypothetical protein [Calditrichota bacterium]MCB9366023.1 hypothetical protein [Calditrichota bacterium]MCB9391851.1 hypothetical protein [Calditrichota bacterium]
MKRLAFALLALMVISPGARAEVELLSMSVNSLVDHARLEWQTGQEINFQTFVIERSPDGQTFLPVGQVAARGSYSEYFFTDESPLDVDRELTFFYRIKLLNRDGTYSYSQILEVSLNISAVQQTWGSIKAMFR